MKAYRLNKNRFLLVSHPHCHTCLAPTLLPPLSKGGGLTAQHKLLLCCFLLVIRLPFQFIKLFCRQDRGIALYPPTSPFPQPSQKHINRFAPHHVFTSPRKRGGGTAVEVFRLAVQYSDSPAFTILKLFRAVTVGIAPLLHQLSQTRTISCPAPCPCLPCQREVA